MSSTRTKNTLPNPRPKPWPAWLKSMAYAEFNALNRGLRSIPEKKNPSPRIGAGANASAIHGRLGAQVALLQSPILPAASPPYTKRKNFRALLVDKPHTRKLAVKNKFLFS